MEIDLPDIEDLPLIEIDKYYKNESITRLTNIEITSNSGVYLLYDEDKQLLYIGESENIRKRASTHRTQLPIKPKYIKFFIVEKGKAYRVGVEHLLIYKYEPRLYGQSTKVESLTSW